MVVRSPGPCLAQNGGGVDMTIVHGKDCANSSCVPTSSAFQDRYVHTGPPPPHWTKTSGTACASSEMMWVGQHAALDMCQAEAATLPDCTSAPTKTVVYER